MAIAAKEVLEVERLQVLTDGRYSNAEEVARCEQEGIEVAAPIKRGASCMPAQPRSTRLTSLKLTRSSEQIDFTVYLYMW
jgi:hypothetical protein